MNITVIGTGYVGLVTGVALSEIGHHVTCIDIDKEKVNQLNRGIPTIYEPGLEELMLKNIKEQRLNFTTEHQSGLKESDVIYIAVGTPQNNDGSANLTYLEQAAADIADNILKDTIVVIKSTVPVGTNHYIKSFINQRLNGKLKVDVVSNPEFLREGTAVKDTFYGDRIVIGADNPESSKVIQEINQAFNVPFHITDTLSSEMIKYASNAFLATKISFINEIANICEKTGANVEEVAKGMGADQRIGPQFLRAGIGYGGSCFPKDTNALVQLAGNHEHDFNLLKSVIEVNNKQQTILLNKINNRFGNVKGKRIAFLGLAFKPDTDDIRESPALSMIPKLLSEGAGIIAYDPIAINNAKKHFNDEISYTSNIEEALDHADFTIIITDWEQIKTFPLNKYKSLLKEPIIFDGRNCYSPQTVEKIDLEYYSIGRNTVNRQLISL